MKKNFLLIATFAGLVLTASAAASNQADSETFVLPTYVVTAPRYQPAEIMVNARLKELQDNVQGRLTVLPAPYLPNLKPAVATHDARLAQIPAVKHDAKS